MLAVAGGFLFVGAKRYLAYRAAYSGTEEGIQRAIHLLPANAQYHYAYGRMLALVQQEPQRSLAEFREAVRLNPHSSQYWRGLAMAYQLTGDIDEQKKALDEAVRVDPKTPLVAQEVGDFYLLRGDLSKAFQQYRTVLENDPNEGPAMLDLGWKATDGDAAFLFDNLLPANEQMRKDLLGFAIKKGSADGARKAWEKIAGLGRPVETQLGLQYVGFMLGARRPEAATSAWAQMTSLDARLADYRPTPANLMVNGGFEEDFLNGGMDWTFARDASVKQEAETTDFHSGTRSLAVSFDGSTPNGLGVIEFVAVKPNTKYRLTFWFKGQELTSTNAPNILVADHYGRAALAETREMRGSTAWEEESVVFTTPADCRLITVQLVRTANAPLIRGRLLLDDFKLVAE